MSCFIISFSLNAYFTAILNTEFLFNKYLLLRNWIPEIKKNKSSVAFKVISK